MTATYTLNPAKNGIEIRFPEKPDSDTLAAIKTAGFRWSRAGSLWYAKQSPAAIDFAKSIARGEAITKQQPAPEAATLSNVTPDGFTFAFNGYRTPGGELVKAISYSFLTDEVDPSRAFCIQLYLDTYAIPPAPKGVRTENDSDSMTDYFSHTTLYVPLTSPAWPAALAGLRRARQHDRKRAEKSEARRNGGRVFTDEEKDAAEAAVRARIYGESLEEATKAIASQRVQKVEHEKEMERVEEECLSIALRLAAARGTADEAKASSEAISYIEARCSACRARREEVTRRTNLDLIRHARERDPQSVEEFGGYVALYSVSRMHEGFDGRTFISYSVSIFDASTGERLGGKEDCASLEEAKRVKEGFAA